MFHSTLIAYLIAALMLVMALLLMHILGVPLDDQGMCAVGTAAMKDLPRCFSSSEESLIHGLMILAALVIGTNAHQRLVRDKSAPPDGGRAR